MQIYCYEEWVSRLGRFFYNLSPQRCIQRFLTLSLLQSVCLFVCFFNYFPSYKSFDHFLRTILSLSCSMAVFKVMAQNFNINGRKNFRCFVLKPIRHIIRYDSDWMLFCLPYCFSILCLVSREITLFPRSATFFYDSHCLFVNF